MAKNTIIVGLDVGGAHLKVARIDDGTLTSARLIACTLWRGIEHLDRALADAAPELAAADQIAITMTGELADLFANRRDGVRALTDYFDARFGTQARFWCGPRGFQSAAFARANPVAVSSMNFFATAAFAAGHVDAAIFADMGSTTTDLIPLRDGHACPVGLTDAKRLATGELVYTGFTRTAVMAIADRVPLDGGWQPVCHEYFATMADVRRVLDVLPDGVDLHDTCDGKGKSQIESENRLARMFGFDGPDAADNVDDDPVMSRASLQAAASYLAEQQLRHISDGLTQVLSANPTVAYKSLVTAGIGAPFLATLAERHGLTILSFDALVRIHACDADTINAAAPAVAVASLFNSL